MTSLCLLCICTKTHLNPFVVLATVVENIIDIADNSRAAAQDHLHYQVIC